MPKAKPSNDSDEFEDLNIPKPPTTVQVEPEPEVPKQPEPQNDQETTEGKSLAKPLGKSLGNPDPRNLGAEFPRESPRESPREFPRDAETLGGAPAGAFQPLGASRSPKDNILGKKRHPRQENGQLNPGVNRFLADGVRLYAHRQGIKLGPATSYLLELGMRIEDPETVAESYADRAAALGAPDDWADISEYLLEKVMRLTDEATVLRVLERLKGEAAGR